MTVVGFIINWEEPTVPRLFLAGGLDGINGDWLGTGAENGLKAGGLGLSLVISSTGRRTFTTGVDSSSRNLTNCCEKD